MTTPAIPASEAEAVLFAHLLSCEGEHPAAFLAATGTAAGRPEHALALLRALAQIEDLGMDTRPGEHEELTAFHQRMESKLDLNLLLLGRVLEQTTAPLPVRRVRWSIRGACLTQPGAAYLPPGTEGVLHIQPCDWLPDPLELPANVLASADDGTLYLRFPDFSPALREALERHLFRQHRRQIAQARAAGRITDQGCPPPA